jgi:t-SNARE complex subunit (syntaxin)
LDKIGQNVQSLKYIAIEMGTEIEKQSGIITEIDVKVSTSNKQLDTLNVKLKRIIEKSRDPAKICVILILLLILIAIFVFIIKNL